MLDHPRPKFTFYGHATVRCDLPGGEVMLIDPWVGQNPACPDELKELERLDAMLITHAHFDHIADAVELAKRHEPEIVVGCFEVCHWLTSKGVKNTSAMNLGGCQEVLGHRVSMVRADHSCGITDGDQILYGGTAAGYVVRLEGGYTFYHAGDTALFTDMQLIAELYRPELVFLPIGDLFTMGPDQAVPRRARGHPDPLGHLPAPHRHPRAARGPPRLPRHRLRDGGPTARRFILSRKSVRHCGSGVQVRSAW